MIHAKFNGDYVIQPVNRFIQISLPPEEGTPEEALVLLPADFTPLENKHTIATVVNWAPDVRFLDILAEGSKVVVDRSMIEEIQVNNELLTVVQDNYIIAILNE